MADYTIHKSSQTETRTRKIRVGSRIKVQEQWRAITIATETTTGTSLDAQNRPTDANVPAPDTASNSGADDSVISSDVDFNPITGKYVKTTVRRVGAAESWQNGDSYWEDTDDGQSQQSAS